MTMRISRRRAVGLVAASTALPLVHIRTAGAAGKVSIGLWDHWVPAGNAIAKKQALAWGEKNKVEVQIDFITTVGNKLVLTQAAEALAKTGHDAMTFRDWDVQNHARVLEPMDTLMKDLTDRYGAVSEVHSYLARSEGAWRAIPASSGSNYKGPVARISLLKQHAGIDVTEMFPARPDGSPSAAKWTYETHLRAAEACHKAGVPFGIGVGGTVDSVDTAGAFLAAFGAELVDARGTIQVKTDAMRQVLEHAQQMVKYLPSDAPSYDDASNNKALIAGKSALIWNPPSAYAVAKRDAPKIAEDCWCFPAPTGPKGSFTPAGPYFWGVWQFAQNKSAAKDLLTFLSERENAEERCAGVEGFDVPPFSKMTDFKVWEQVGPPAGTMYNYVIRPFHKSRPHIAGYPAPPEIGVQAYQRAVAPGMFARLMRGENVKQVQDWAAKELEGFSRG